MRRAAFSLVELSIVLVILGLLVGGILAGQSLIRASQLRAVGTEYSRFTAATFAFRDKYFALPGDWNQAITVWGAAASCPGDSDTVVTGTLTCNGNMNGMIWYTDPTSNEPYQFWRQLANAGLLEGTFNGVSNSTTNVNYDRINFNIPASKMPNAGWAVQWVTAVIDVANTSYFEGPYGNVFMFGGQSPTGVRGSPALRTEDAWNIDSKLDDGRPGTGRVRTYESAINCHDAGTSAANPLAQTAQYRLSRSTIDCPLIFLPF